LMSLIVTCPVPRYGDNVTAVLGMSVHGIDAPQAWSVGTIL
jgi:hypothetical protein